MTLRDFQQDFNKNFNKIANLLEEVVSDLTEQVDSARVRNSLNSALDVLRSFSKCLGFRVSQLSRQKVELHLPRKPRLLENGRFSDGALIATGIEAARLLWNRNAPENCREFSLRGCEWKQIKSCQTEAIVRIEFSEVARETALAELEKEKKTSLQLMVLYFDENDQLCAELSLQIGLTASELLEWK